MGLALLVLTHRVAACVSLAPERRLRHLQAVAGQNRFRWAEITANCQLGPKSSGLPDAQLAVVHKSSVPTTRHLWRVRLPLCSGSCEHGTETCCLARQFGRNKSMRRSAAAPMRMPRYGFGRSMRPFVILRQGSPFLPMVCCWWFRACVSRRAIASNCPSGPQRLNKANQ